MMDICSIRYETHLLVHWWTVVEAIRKSRDSSLFLTRASTVTVFSSVLRESSLTPQRQLCFTFSVRAPQARWIGGSLRTAEQARASLREISNIDNKFFQANKSQRWMPWRQEPMKDVSDCEKLRGAVY